MGLRFRRSVRLFPGVRLNFSGGGLSTTIGVRSASVNLGTHGAYSTWDCPGPDSRTGPRSHRTRSHHLASSCLAEHLEHEASTFIAPDGDAIRVTRRAADLFDLPDATEVLAHWHGQRLTEPFRLTVGTLKRLGGWDDGAMAKPIPPRPLRPLTGKALERRRRLLGLPA
jgi:hypothetical protein